LVQIHQVNLLNAIGSPMIIKDSKNFLAIILAVYFSITASIQAVNIFLCKHYLITTLDVKFLRFILCNFLIKLSRQSLLETEKILV